MATTTTTTTATTTHASTRTMPPPTTLLTHLRTHTPISCDTLDPTIAANPALGPFEDCTSNQAIALAELSLPTNLPILKRAAHLSLTWPDLDQKKPLYTTLSTPSLAVEIAMVLLALRMAPHISGRIHIQVNPKHAYSADETVQNALRIRALVLHIDPTFPASTRLCVKIPATFPGLAACRVLERDHGVRTLATTLFNIEQAVVAARVGCAYVAPYVNELKVHFQVGYVDPAPALALCVRVQRWYWRRDVATRVLPASLVRVEECAAVAGVGAITIAPVVLALLAGVEVGEGEVRVGGRFGSMFEVGRGEGGGEEEEYEGLEDDEARFDAAMAASDGGRDAEKLRQALELFGGCQEGLERLVEGVLEA